MPRTGVELIQTERTRQLKEWSPQHDKEHDNNELIRAAIALLMIEMDATEMGRSLWPWEPERFQKDVERPNNFAAKVHRLRKAGALVAAELDRIIN